jgi:hypothetical protein
MEPAAADPVRVGSMEKRSLLGLELEIAEDDDDEEDVEKEADCRPGDHRRRRQSPPAAYDEDDELCKKRRLWQTYTGRRNLIASLPVVVGGLLLLVFVLREGT